MKRRIPVLLVVLAILAVGIYYATRSRQSSMVLTGIVATDSVRVSSEIQGRLEQLLVRRGDTVRSNELLARIQPQEWKADMAFYESSQKQSASQVTQAEADLRFQQAQASNEVNQAEANLAATRAQLGQAEADLENARLNFKRIGELHQQGVESAQLYDQARTSNEAAQARADSVRKQVQSAQAAVALAKAKADQVAAQRAVVEANLHRLAAAGAQTEKAKVQLDYTQIRAPVEGIVDVRAALEGEVVDPGQTIVTLIDPDNLWVRADVEESYIDQVYIGEKMMVRFASGLEREGTVFFRGVDAEYATQRDVSRTKRDIKTFQIRLRCNNSDRRLAVGMTAYVTMPLESPRKR